MPADPVRDGPRWEGFDGCLPELPLRPAASGRLPVISEIHVPSRVRRQDQDQDRVRNLARRPQRRLLTDHGAVTPVNRSDHVTVEVPRSWGRYIEGDTPRTAPLGPFRVPVLGT